jgi:hypothetical protein
MWHAATAASEHGLVDGQPIPVPAVVCSVSWDDWVDKQSGIAGYAYQIVGVSDLMGRGKATVFTNASAMVRLKRHEGKRSLTKTYGWTVLT